MRRAVADRVVVVFDLVADSGEGLRHRYHCGFGGSEYLLALPAPWAVIRRRMGDQIVVRRDAVDTRLRQLRAHRLDDLVEGLQERAETQPPVVVEIEAIRCLSGILAAGSEGADDGGLHVEVHA